MTAISSLQHVHKKGLFGDYEDKDEKNLIKISEVTNLLIVQIVQHKGSNVSLRGLKVGELNLSNEALKVNFNNDTRILWNGPNNWFLISKNKELLKNIHKTFNETDFAITDLSHSRAVIELEGENTKEVLKKGCPFNFNELHKNTCINSIFNGITVTIDMIEDSPNKIRLYALRSFGESLHHSITDACLEFGFKAE